MALYHETINIENALKKQISESVEELYLEELRDPTTNTILATVPFILNHLITNYGEIEPDTLSEKEQLVRKMQFTVSDPFTKLWKQIEDIGQLSTAENSPYTQNQLVNIALHVIKSTNDYERGLSDWYALPTVNQTWLTLKQHFQKARRDLRKMRGGAMRDAGFHQANQISEEIKDVKENLNSMQEAQRHVLAAIEDNQSMMSQVANHIGNHYVDGRYGVIPQEYADENIPPTQPSVNSTITNHSNDMVDALKSLKNEIRNIKSTMNALKNHQSNTNQPFNHGSAHQPPYGGRFGGGRGGRGGQHGRGGGRGGRGDRSARGGGRGQGQGRGQPPRRTNISKYCHTHGACGHPSWYCNKPREGHQWDATFANKMGGSTYYCE